MFERIELEVLKKRMDEPRKFIQVIIGPRQVGKTTIVHQLLKDYSQPFQYESADAVAAGNGVWLTQVWESARLRYRTSHSKEFLLVIDEIQKVSNWSEIVKKQWDQDSKEHFSIKLILLGSSRLLVQKGLSESLAGRFETIHLSHWSFLEMEQAFGWDSVTYAWFGGYPGSAELIGDEPRWKKYIRDSLIETSISKDILMLTRIDKPALLKNLFELGCSYSGQILSMTKILGQLQDAGNTTTLSHYLKLLEMAGLLCGLEKYSASVIRKRSASPKFQVLNNALLSALLPMSLADIYLNPSAWGRVVESSIGAYLVNSSLQQGYSVYYWRERNEEVDFILEKNNKIVAIEVKSTEQHHAKGMTAFGERFNPDKLYLIGNSGLLWQDFLRIKPIELF